MCKFAAEAAHGWFGSITHSRTTPQEYVGTQQLSRWGVKKADEFVESDGG